MIGRGMTRVQCGTEQDRREVTRTDGRELRKQSHIMADDMDHTLSFMRIDDIHACVSFTSPHTRAHIHRAIGRVDGDRASVFNYTSQNNNIFRTVIASTVNRSIVSFIQSVCDLFLSAALL